MSDEQMVEIPETLANELADHHKDVARHGYQRNQTRVADQHHSWARRINDAVGRDWQEVGDA